MKRKTKGNEITDADVKFISLVPKGANGIPLKIKKNDEGKTVMDLSSLFTQNPDSPFVAAVIVNKAADLEEVKARISKAGFSVEDQEDADGVVIFKQEEVPEGYRTFVIKTDEDVALQVTAKKSFTPGNYEESSFKDLFSQAGVLPGINAAMDVLGVVIGNILFNQDTATPDDAAMQIKAAIKEFSNMIVEMVSAVPVTAFKMEVQKAKDKPYGEVKYADPGYQKDKKARYPIDTEEHIRAAWSYINKEKNAGEYTPAQVSSIKKKIVAAWKKVIDPKGPPSAVTKAEGETQEKDTTMTKEKAKEQVEKTAEELAAEAAAVEKAKGDKAKADAEDAKDNGDDEDMENADGTKKKKDKAKKEDDDAAAAQALADAAAAELAKKSAEPTLADVLKALAGVSEQVTTLKTSTDEAIAAVKKEVGEVSKIAKSANEAIEGIALSEGSADREAVKKAAAKPRALYDTGFQKPQ